MNAKLKSVTVIELAIALLISAIVIGIAYNSMDIFHRLYARFLFNNEDNHQLMDFKRVFRNDLEKAEMLFRQGSSVLLFENDKHTISYEWFEDYILRQNISSSTDTFYVHSSIINSEFNGISASGQELPIDKIYLEFYKSSESINFVFVKKYAADVYMNPLNQTIQ